MAEDERRDFFVSFNQADRAWATWIAWVLEQGGYSVFFQDWDFRGSFIEQMHQATQRTERTLVVLSDNYLNSEFARSEAWATLASDPVGRKDRVVTIKVGPTGDLGLLAHFAYLDLTADGEAEAERLLCERARMSLEPGYRPKPADRPRFPGGAAKPAFPPPTPGPKVAVNNLPPINPDFVGREAVLAELRRLLLANQGPAVLTQAISGLGGIGKTQTARAYAYRHLADYDLIWWLRAETQATLAADYAALAEPLGLDPDTADQAKLIAAVRQRLQSGSGWLLILDNVEDPTLPRDWLPRTGGGHALITSRRTDWRERAKVLSLELMPEDEALQLLTGRSDPQALSPAELAQHAAAVTLAAGARPPAAGPGAGPRLHGRDRQEPRRLSPPVPRQSPRRLRRRHGPAPTTPRATPPLGCCRSRPPRLPAPARGRFWSCWPSSPPSRCRSRYWAPILTLCRRSCAASAPATTPWPPCAATLWSI